MWQLLLAAFIAGILSGEIMRRIMSIYFSDLYVPRDKIWKRISDKINKDDTKKSNNSSLGNK